MSELRIIFTDGTSELRPANSPAIMSTLAPRWMPSDTLEAYEWTPGNTYAFGARGYGLSSHPLRALRPDPITVWCIVGQDATTGALRGEWRNARVESLEEQVERLEGDRYLTSVAYAWFAKLAEVRGQTIAKLQRRLSRKGRSISRLRAERDAETARADGYKRRVCALRMALKRIENSDSARFIAGVASSALSADDAAR